MPAIAAISAMTSALRASAVDSGEGAKRAVMDDVRIGDRQYHPVVPLPKQRVEHILEIDDIRLAVGRCLSFMPWSAMITTTRPPHRAAPRYLSIMA